jgi:hypothetical protein
MENCTELIHLTSIKNIRFKKLDRKTLSVSVLIELKKQIEDPIKVSTRNFALCSCVLL